MKNKTKIMEKDISEKDILIKIMNLDQNLNPKIISLNLEIKIKNKYNPKFDEKLPINL